MIFSPKQELFGVSLKDPTGAKFVSPIKGVKVKFRKLPSGQIGFELIGKNSVLSPILLRMKVAEDGIVTGDIFDVSETGLKVDISLEKGPITSAYKFKKDKILVDRNDRVYYLHSKDKYEQTGFTFEVVPIEADEFLNKPSNHYIALKNVDGMYAICNTETLAISPFMFNQSEYAMVADISSDKEGASSGMYVVKTPIEDENISDSLYVIVGENGKVLKSVKSSQFLWKKVIDEKTDSGEKKFAYFAFKTGDLPESTKTTIVKIDTETLEVDKDYQVPGESHIHAFKPKFRANTKVLDDGSVVLITELKIGGVIKYGASLIMPNGEQKVLLENNNDSAIIKTNAEGTFVYFINGETSGRVETKGNVPKMKLGIRAGVLDAIRARRAQPQVDTPTLEEVDKEKAETDEKSVPQKPGGPGDE